MSWKELVGNIKFGDLDDKSDGVMVGTKAMTATLEVSSRTDYANEVIDDETFTAMHEQLAENIHRALYESIIEQVMKMSNNFEFLYSKSDLMDTDQQTAWMDVMDAILDIKKDMGMQS